MSGGLPSGGIPAPEFASVLDSTFGWLAEAREGIVRKPLIQEVGVVSKVGNGIATVRGLPGVRLDELVEFQDGSLGVALQLDEQEIGCAVLGRADTLSAGSSAKRLGRVLDVPVGEGLLGRVLSPLGAALDGAGPLVFSHRAPIEREAPPIVDRLPVRVPLETGVKVVDALLPIGRGQRQLILGDRQTGKTALALAAMVNQRDKGLVSVYCAIGQRGASVARVVARLRETGALSSSVVIVAEPDQGPGPQFIAPYAATSVAERFMEKGRDVLIVYDDLGCHARAYRELSLLLRRPPGREAFPGDIFYIHSRLLERSTRLVADRGGGSLTALPIVETEAQNLSAYIPTNLISITDGQIYLSPLLFQKGVLPAVDIGISVSRVGGKAQYPVYRAVSSEVKLLYSQFEELEMFSRFGTRLDESTRRVIEHGRRIRHCLKQGAEDLLDVFQQVLILFSLTRGLLDKVPEKSLDEAEKALRGAAGKFPAELAMRITGREPLSRADEQALQAIAEETLRGFFEEVPHEEGVPGGLGPEAVSVRPPGEGRGRG